MSSDEALQNGVTPEAAAPQEATSDADATRAPETEATDTASALESSTDSAGMESASNGSGPNQEPADPALGETDSAHADSAPAEPDSSDKDSSDEDATSETTAQADSAEEQRSVKLAPTGALKAVGSVGTASIEDAVVSEAEVAAAFRDNTVLNEEGEIEIPRDVDLGDLENEIEAAMQSDQKTAEAVGENDQSNRELPSQGDRIQGIVQSLHGEDVFLDLGARIPGILAIRQFEGTEPPQVGQKVKVVVRKVDEEEGLIAVNLPSGKQRVGGNWDAVEEGQIVDCVVNKTNKGGLEVSVGSLRGFLPASQVDFGFIENLDSYVGQKLQVKIIEAKREKRNLVVSRRQVLIDERREAEQSFWETIEEGAEYTGRVKTIKEYGAFVDLGGADGFLHIGQIAWNHIKHPNEVLSEGQEVTVKVIKADREANKISLSMKQLIENPWVTGAAKYAPESVVGGTVTRIEDFGAFVELEPGIEGLVHISELDYKRVNKVTDVLKIGQEIETKVVEYDGNRKRIRLSLKALKEDPRKAEEEQRKADSEAVAAANAAKRARREDLRGGIGTPGTGGGGLFGNPSDFE